MMQFAKRVMKEYNKGERNVIEHNELMYCRNK